MKYHKLDQIETEVRDKGISGLKFMQNERICRISRADGTTPHYFPTETEKERIVLHFTVGNLRGDITTLTGDGKVSTAFVIARNGQIYQLFDPKYWAYHLGRGAQGGNMEESSKTIGIELSNYGPLVPDKTNAVLNTVYSTIQRPDPYCELSEKAAFQKLSAPFRGYSFFATFTSEQYHSLIWLLQDLTQTFEIPRHFLDRTLRHTSVFDVTQFHGIVSHVNYRSSGKWDIGPAFDWDKVIEGVTAHKQ